MDNQQRMLLTNIQQSIVPANTQRRVVQTNTRDSILQDPHFQSARQILNQSLQDFRRAAARLGVPVMAGPEAMHEMLSCMGSQLCYQPTSTTSRTGNLNPLSITMHTDNMEFKPECFQIVMDMKGFTPEDITVTLQGNVLDVSATTEVQGPSSIEQKAMQRRYYLPRNVQADALQSNLSSDGILVLSAPWQNALQ
ncbi:uncharacterized protein [Periplaneta americana]|uniref:uncharacterized protein n=1 Tax=Periplaneta americana TaxID=6978 RepID=UPI0037E947DD